MTACVIDGHPKGDAGFLFCGAEREASYQVVSIFRCNKEIEKARNKKRRAIKAIKASIVGPFCF